VRGRAWEAPLDALPPGNLERREESARSGVRRRLDLLDQQVAVIAYRGGNVDFRFWQIIDRTGGERVESDGGAVIVRLETMMTGMGRNRIRLRRKLTPSIFGISTSSVSTSGIQFLDLVARGVGVARRPSTSIEGSPESSSVSNRRTSAESSTINTPMRLLGLIVVQSNNSISSPAGCSASASGNARRSRRRLSTRAASSA